MKEKRGASGNPVFDYKAAFRVRAAFVQNVLFVSGFLLIAAGIAGRFFTVADEAWVMAIRYAPVEGVGLWVASGVWGYAWRSKLRGDFVREFG